MHCEVAAAVTLAATLLCLQMSVDTLVLRKFLYRVSDLLTPNGEQRTKSCRCREDHAKAKAEQAKQFCVRNEFKKSINKILTIIQQAHSHHSRI